MIKPYVTEFSDLTLARSAADVGDEAPPAGVWLGGALLTGVAPGSTNGGAAEGFGADDPAELALAHLVVHLGETWPRPVVCGEKNPRLAGDCLIDQMIKRSSGNIWRRIK